MSSQSKAPFFVISLDFELFWGMYDVVSLGAYGKNILGVRQAIPAMLELFREFDVGATWATVGFVTFENKRDLLAHAPDLRPEYLDQARDPYRHLEGVGEDEARDPYHFGYSLVRRILDTPRMELGSHTFSHLCALEPRRNPAAFRADLFASRSANARFGITSESVVFPRNQYDRYHLDEAAAAGFSVYRGTQDHRWYQNGGGHDQATVVRAGRLLDSYVNLSGHSACRVSRDESGMANVPASRFLRPSGGRLSVLDPLLCRRALDSMRFAAGVGGGFHLWWHPHNFGAELDANLACLRGVLEEFRRLQNEFGMRSLTMLEAYRHSVDRDVLLPPIPHPEQEPS